MDDLSSLRHASYEAAGKYHQAHGKFFNSLSRRNVAGVSKAAIQARIAGAEYKAALLKLIDYLTESGEAATHKDEIIRAVQVSDLLEKELQILSSYPSE